jgi:3-hydroxy acid dehydrogenase/malonic semialdehyde reductase
MSGVWSNRVVLVTGATAGFGAAIARRFAAEGARVVACGRRRDRLDALRTELGANLHPVMLDVRDRRAVEAAIATLPAAVRDLDLLVNNAGLALGIEPAHAASLDDWEDMVDTNLKGLMYVTHAVLPGMVERNRGHIINMGSTAGSMPYPGGNLYGATKAAVAQFSANLLADLVKTRVRVTCIEPGLCGGSEFSLVRFHGDTDKADKVYRGTQPLTAEDIAESVLWAASQPAHVNISRIEMLPTCQAPAGWAIHREG